MKFFLKNKKRILVIIFLGILLFLLLNFYQKEIKNFFYLISSPVQKILWKAGERVSDFFEMIVEMKNLKKENQELKLKIEELLAENVSLKELKKQNEILRTALGINLEKEFQLILTQVIGKDISQDYLLIDKGSREGVKTDFPIITQEKILVGKITEVYENFSKLILISNKKSSFDAKISEREIYGMVKGKGNFKINLELVPKEKELKEGDLVISSAIGGIFPAGILVGKIEKIKKSDVEPFQQAEIKPGFDINNLQFLFIIKK